MPKSSFALFSKTTVLTVQPPEIRDKHESRIDAYLNKIMILKQIMSNKSRLYRRINATQNTATVVASSLLLFFGFTGVQKIHNYISRFLPIDGDTTEIGFNLLVFLMFVIATLHLVFQFSQKQSRAEMAVASLAALANEIEDMLAPHGNLAIIDHPAKIDLIRTRYEAVAATIPANSDSEFIRAKTDLAKKESQKPRLHISPQQLFDSAQQKEIVSSIVLGSRTIVDILLALRDTDETLYLGGGLIRNAVWDYLHGYSSPTPIDDVDVVYFNRDDCEKRHDEELDSKLAKSIPNIRWSVKNQARMHSANSESPYDSLTDAISRWPETATAIIVRLTSAGKLEFIAPYEFDDLLRLIVKSTPAFKTRIDKIRERARTKGWLRTWPNLRIVLPDDLANTGSLEA